MLVFHHEKCSQGSTTRSFDIPRFIELGWIRSWLWVTSSINIAELPEAPLCSSREWVQEQ